MEKIVGVMVNVRCVGVFVLISIVAQYRKRVCACIKIANT